MFTDDELLMISGLQHFAFCERQWALIHLEQMWAENRFTVEGENLHEKVHRDEEESRTEVRIVRGLRVCSHRLGLIGRADVVEFQRLASEDAVGSGMRALGIRIPRKSGVWRPVPVEYKRGKPKEDPCDEMQLCAQALCLEEMLEIEIHFGALYYGKPKRRFEVLFDERLRENTKSVIDRMHELFQRCSMPVGRFDAKCRSCSLESECLPKLMKRKGSVWSYLVEQGIGAALKP
jgi:CRISPR-associated exonuclease Cas4